MKSRCRASISIPLLLSTPMAVIWASIASIIFRTCILDSGKSFTSHQGTAAIPYSIPVCAGRRLYLLRPPFSGRRSRVGMNGAEIVFNPSATVGDSGNTCGIGAAAHAVANGYFVGAINRVGRRSLGTSASSMARVLLQSRGQIFAQASRNKDEVLVADLDLDMIADVRKTWQFFRDRRPRYLWSTSRRRLDRFAAD